MDKYIEKLLTKFEDDVIYDNNNITIDERLKDIEDKIIKYSNSYYESDDSLNKDKIKDNIIRYYNLLYYYQFKKFGFKDMFKPSEDLRKLPEIYLIDDEPERFEIDENLLKNIDISNGLTMEEALELLKWTSNNTRDNLERGSNLDVYGNSSLIGCCGFSQYSTLYPLKEMGLKVTINNTSNFFGGRHAFGTVVIPIRAENKIVNKRFLIDCSYRQFFTVTLNVVSRYLKDTPLCGFFINKSKDDIEFARELLRNGFIEATEDNLSRYLKPFFSETVPLEETKKIDKKFKKIDIIKILETEQEEFDYEPYEFERWGLNLELPTKKRKRL